MRTETTIVVFAFLALIFFGVAVLLDIAYPHGIQQQSGTIDVSATGIAYGYPSRAVLALFINSSGSTPEIATSNLSFSISMLNNTLLKFIDNNFSLIKTESYSMFKQPNSSRYVALEQLEASIPNINNISDVLQSIAPVPNVYVSGVQSILSDNQTNVLREQALSLALANATSQAQTIAGNDTYISIRNVTINGYTIYPYTAFAGALVPSFKGASPIFFSGITGVKESVSVVFSFKK